jgi:hypothetical protein
MAVQINMVPNIYCTASSWKIKQRAGQRKFWRLDELDHCQVKPN